MRKAKKLLFLSGPVALSLALASLVSAQTAPNLPECNFTSAPTAAQMQACTAAAQAAMQGATQSSGQTSDSSGGSSMTAPTMPDVSSMMEGVQMGPSEDQLKKIEEQKLQGMKKGVASMDKGLKKMEANYASMEKTGLTIPQELKDKLTRARTIVDTIMNATTAEEIENVDTDEFSTLMEQLGDAIGTLKERAQILSGMKKAVKSMEKGVAVYEKQMSLLTKQNIAIPADVTENLDKVKALIAAIKSGKSWEELEAAGIDDIDAIFDKLEESRQKIEVLIRWPKTIKRVDNEIKLLEKALVRSKKLADKKSADIDLTSAYTKFSDGITALKTARDEAVAKKDAGEAMEAFDLLEEKFYGQIEAVYGSQRIIELMAGVSNFASAFRTNMSAAQKQVTMVAKQKIDTTELKDLLAQMKTKGNEVLALVKAKPVNEEAVLAGLEEFETLRLAFETKKDSLAADPMPWEQGTNAIKPVVVPKEMDNLINKQSALEEKQKASAE